MNPLTSTFPSSWLRKKTTRSISKGYNVPKLCRDSDAVLIFLLTTRIRALGATEQKSRRNFLEGAECVREMVIFDAMPRDFKVVKQSAISWKYSGWQSNVLRSSKVAPTVSVTANGRADQFPRFFHLDDSDRDSPDGESTHPWGLHGAELTGTPALNRHRQFAHAPRVAPQRCCGSLSCSTQGPIR